MRRPLLLAFALSFICLPAFAVTQHIDVTPELAGERCVTMKTLDGNMTRFTIRISTENDPTPLDPRRPFVRGGSLDVRGEHGHILRCSIQPKERGRDLLYTFDLENGHAKNTWFVLVEHFDDGQVGGGKVFSYRLIDFIDPDYRGKELFQHIRPPALSGIEIPSTLLLPNKEDESDSP
jgi:hypothetical protein